MAYLKKKVSSQRTKGRGIRPIVPCALFLSREPPTGSTKRLPRRRERYGAALVGRKNIWPTLILQDPDNFNTTVFFFSTQSELSILSGRAGKNVLQ